MSIFEKLLSRIMSLGKDMSFNELKKTRDAVAKEEVGYENT